jgi:hypothetical protein
MQQIRNEAADITKNHSCNKYNYKSNCYKFAPELFLRLETSIAIENGIFSVSHLYTVVNYVQHRPPLFATKLHHLVNAIRDEALLALTLVVS